MNGLQHRPIEPLLKDTIIYNNKKISFTCRNNIYHIYATWQKRKVSGTDEYEFRDYKVFMETTIDGKPHKQLLASKGQADHEMWLRFAGDIDGDGIPDLIIDTSGHENTERPTLYLSKPATKGQLLKVMGLHTVVGC